MIVQCPRCETTFSLADELYQAGRKARCSQCKNIFVLPEGTVASEKDAGTAVAGAEHGSKKGGKGKFFLTIAIILILAGIGYGSYMLYSLLSVAPEKTEVEDVLKNIQVENLRQITVNNAKTGKIIVISGHLVNNTNASKQMLSVQVRLLDEQDNVLASKQQVAGVTLSQFQLEMLSESELEMALNNTVDIVVNNTDVEPGGSVPFHILFFNAPEFMFFDVTPVLAKAADELPPAQQ